MGTARESVALRLFLPGMYLKGFKSVCSLAFNSHSFTIHINI